MVNSRTIVRIFIEVLGEIMAAAGAFLLLGASATWINTIISLFFLFPGITLRIYGDEISIAIYEGNWKEKLLRWN